MKRNGLLRHERNDETLERVDTLAKNTFIRNRPPMNIYHLLRVDRIGPTIHPFYRCRGRLPLRNVGANGAVAKLDEANERRDCILANDEYLYLHPHTARNWRRR